MESQPDKRALSNCAQRSPIEAVKEKQNEPSKPAAASHPERIILLPRPFSRSRSLCSACRSRTLQAVSPSSRDGWLMAIGIDLGFVALELSMLVAPADKRLAVARYASSVPSPHRSNEIPCSVRCSPG
jgi:hypothetical protein